MTPLSERQKTLIVNNVVNACKNIDNLNKTGYNFLYQASGFIAHYDLYGFIANYKEDSLKADILRNTRANEWRNFHPKDENYEYYMGKADVYTRIVEAIK